MAARELSQQEFFATYHAAVTRGIIINQADDPEQKKRSTTYLMPDGTQFIVGETGDHYDGPGFTELTACLPEGDQVWTRDVT